MRIFLSNRKIKLVLDLKDGDGQWRGPEELNAQVRSTRLVGAEGYRKLQRRILEGKLTSNKGLATITRWHWPKETKPSFGWKHPNRIWALQIALCMTQNDELNKLWLQQGTLEDWKKQVVEKAVEWVDSGQHKNIHLENSEPWLLYERESTILRSLGWVVQQMRHSIHRETTDHLFFECLRVRARWQQIATMLVGSVMDGCIHRTLFYTISQVVRVSKRRPGVNPCDGGL